MTFLVEVIKLLFLISLDSKLETAAVATGLLGYGESLYGLMNLVDLKLYVSYDCSNDFISGLFLIKLFDYNYYGWGIT